MVKGLYTASTGMVNEQRRVDVIANNLANASTNGYKAEGATSESFKEVLAYKIKDTSESGLPRKLGIMSPGVKIGETYTDYSQGAFEQTNNTFDLAISGDGFFNIEFTDKKGNTSVMYTRDGSFSVNPKGEVVNKNGDYLLDDKGKHIKVDPLKESQFDSQGNIYQDGAIVGHVNVTDFADYNYLEKYGETYYSPVEGIEEQETDASVISGYIERSNVQAVKEMVNLINFQRAYETNQRMIQAHDSTIGTAVNDLGKV